MSQWRAGSYAIDGGYAHVRVAGWLFGHFGIDRRAENAWHVTHIPTGYGAGCLLLPFDKVRQFVEAIESVADWDFTDPEEARTRGPAVAKVEKELGIRRSGASGTPEGMPITARGSKPVRAETGTGSVHESRAEGLAQTPDSGA